MTRTFALFTALRASLGGLCVATSLHSALAEAATRTNVEAACASTPPHYLFLRFGEDWRAMRVPECRRDALDSLKAIPLDETGEHWLTLGGNIRLDLLNASPLAKGDVADRNVLLQRYHIHASLALTTSLRGFAELKVNQQIGRRPGPLPSDVDHLDVHQAFVDIGAEPTSLLRVGRQELLYGSGRRIFPRNGTNVRGSFDAVVWKTQFGDWRADMFAFRPVAVDPGSFDDNTINGQTFVGIYATASHAALAPASLDLYAIGAHRAAARYQQGSASEHRRTVGARWSGRFGAWDHDHELTWQWGRFGAAPIRAWAIAGETGHTWRDAARRPRASLRVSVASGDHDPADPALQTFYSLFPRGIALDEGAISVSPANLTHARAALEFDVSSVVRGLLAANTQWRTSRRDGVYDPLGPLQRSAGHSTARHVDDSVDLAAAWTMDRHAALAVAFSFLMSGRFADETGANRTLTALKTTFLYRF